MLVKVIQKNKGLANIVDISLSSVRALDISEDGEATKTKICGKRL